MAARAKPPIENRPLDAGPASTSKPSTKAEAKRAAKTCKACGGGDHTCGGGDDLTPAAIGFAPNCPSITVPGGPSCAATITTLQDIVTSVGCVTEFKADCMDRASVPAVASYPAECNP